MGCHVISARTDAVPARCRESGQGQRRGTGTCSTWPGVRPLDRSHSEAWSFLLVGVVERGVHEFRGLAFPLRKDVGVDLAGRFGIAVAEALLHDVFGNTGVRSSRRGGVPGVV